MAANGGMEKNSSPLAENLETEALCIEQTISLEPFFCVHVRVCETQKPQNKIHDSSHRRSRRRGQESTKIFCFFDIVSKKVLTRIHETQWFPTLKMTGIDVGGVENRRTLLTSSDFVVEKGVACSIDVEARIEPIILFYGSNVVWTEVGVCNFLVSPNFVGGSSCTRHVYRSFSGACLF